MNRQTTFTKPMEADRGWHLIDGEGQVVGRLATRIAMILMGKHRPGYTPFIDTGEFVVVVNAEKLVLTGRKAEQKYVKSYSGYPSGLKQTTYEVMMKRRPERILELAVRRMLPKSDLGRKMLKKLKVYRGAEHPHQAQRPRVLELETAGA